MSVGEGMLNEDMSGTENADEFSIISNCNRRETENMFASRIYFWTPPL